MEHNKNHRKEKFLEILKSQQASGLSQKEYCKTHRIKLSTFQYWKYTKNKKSNPKPNFIKVDTVVPDSLESDSSVNEYEVAIKKDLSIKIKGGNLSTILLNLQEAGLC
jgi:hypothetical protein